MTTNPVKQREIIGRVVFAIVGIGLFLIAVVLVAIWIPFPNADISREGDTNREDTFRGIDFKAGMTIDEIKEKFGEPDRYNPEENVELLMRHDERSLPYQRIQLPLETLEYGLYSPPGKNYGKVIWCELSLHFHEGRLRHWSNRGPAPMKYKKWTQTN